MTFIKPNARPECSDLRLVSQRVPDPENPKRSQVDTYLFCNQYNKKIYKRDCVLCPEYKPLTQ